MFAFRGDMSSQKGLQPFSGAIAHVTFSGDFGGREKVALELCRSLRDLGQESLLFVVVEERAGEKRNQNLLESLGDFSHFGQTFRTRSRFSPWLLFALSKSLRDRGVRIVHCHCYKSLYYAAMMRFMGLFDALVVYTLHGLILPNGFMASLIRGCQRIGLRMSDGVIGCSREVLATSFPNPNGVRTAAIINAIELPADNFEALQAAKSQARNELVKRYSLDPDGLIVINVGRICPQKNYEMYLDLIQLDRADNPSSNTNYLIVGDGELQRELEAKADLLGLRSRLVFTGFASDMDTVYRGADILVQTSIWEGTPMCLLEARSYGLPVVAPAVGGNVDLIESGRDGFLYPVRDMNTLMDRYASYVASPELRQSHGKAAFERIGSESGTRDWALKHMDFYDGLNACGAAQ